MVIADKADDANDFIQMIQDMEAMVAVVAVLIVIAIVVLGEYTKTRGRFLITALVVEGYFFCSLGPAWVAER
ncbi:MAG: hypothetical protein VCF25_14185, partial [Candidatus Poribacteria bacterium]